MHRRGGDDREEVEEDGDNSPFAQARRGGGGGGRWGRLSLLGVGVLLAYVGLIHYLTTSHRGQAQTAGQQLQPALAELEKSLNHIEKEAKALGEELERKKDEVEDLKRQLEERDRKLSTQEKKIQVYDKLQDRISETGLVKALQKQESIFNMLRWGKGPARVLFETEKGDIEIETAPFDSMPHSIHWFLTLVDTGFWDGCHVIRNAAHVIQLNCNGRNPPHSRQPSIAFQEFTPEFNHLPYTLGIAGRPGGPDFYFNLIDNVRNHGPGGQGPEADPCFAKIVKGKDVVDRLHKTLGNEFLKKPDYVMLRKVRILKTTEGRK